MSGSSPLLIRFALSLCAWTISSTRFIGSFLIRNIKITVCYCPCQSSLAKNTSWNVSLSAGCFMSGDIWAENEIKQKVPPRYLKFLLLRCIFASCICIFKAEKGPEGKHLEWLKLSPGLPRAAELLPFLHLLFFIQKCIFLLLKSWWLWITMQWRWDRAKHPILAK